MTADQQQILFDRYPKLFRQKDLPKTQTCMCWGITCGPGWFQLLDDLCAQLALLDRVAGVHVEFMQLKSKLATLRAYYDIVELPEYPGEDQANWHNIVAAIVETAERRSASTCEETGRYGDLYVRGGWYKTLNLDYVKTHPEEEWERAQG